MYYSILLGMYKSGSRKKMLEERRPSLPKDENIFHKIDCTMSKSRKVFKEH